MYIKGDIVICVHRRINIIKRDSKFDKIPVNTCEKKYVHLKSKFLIIQLLILIIILRVFISLDLLFATRRLEFHTFKPFEFMINLLYVLIKRTDLKLSNSIKKMFDLEIIFVKKLKNLKIQSFLIFKTA